MSWDRLVADRYRSTSIPNGRPTLYLLRDVQQAQQAGAALDPRLAHQFAQYQDALRMRGRQGSQIKTALERALAQWQAGTLGRGGSSSPLDD